jgi:hypothetical protein
MMNTCGLARASRAARAGLPHARRQHPPQSQPPGLGTKRRSPATAGLSLCPPNSDFQERTVRCRWHCLTTMMRRLRSIVRRRRSHDDLRAVNRAMLWSAAFVGGTIFATYAFGGTRVEGLVVGVAAFTVSLAYLQITVGLVLDRWSGRRQRRIEHLLERIADSLDPPETGRGSRRPSAPSIRPQRRERLGGREPPSARYSTTSTVSTPSCVERREGIGWERLPIPGNEPPGN